MFEKTYEYVGPDMSEYSMEDNVVGYRVKSRQDVLGWIKAAKQETDNANEIVATFVVKKDKCLYLADRHEEHFNCAGGAPVLSAGEITFYVTSAEFEVTALTNQSTGYCPEPKTRKVVCKALKKAGIAGIDNFTTEFEFRKCTQCDSLNVVKEDWFVCAVCDSDLSKSWNLHS